MNHGATVGDLRNEPRRVSQVEQEIVRLNNTVAGLEKALHELGGRLSAVTRPAAPPAGNKGEVAAIAMVPVAREIASSADAIDAIRANVDSLIDRLEA